MERVNDPLSHVCVFYKPETRIRNYESKFSRGQSYINDKPWLYSKIHMINIFNQNSRWL